jgi:hypothetical protein
MELLSQLDGFEKLGKVRAAQQQQQQQPGRTAQHSSRHAAFSLSCCFPAAC